MARKTRPCRPTRQNQVAFIKHIYTQSQARRHLVRVVQLVQVKSEEKYTLKHFYTQSERRGQLRVIQLVQVKSEEKFSFKHFYTQSQARRQLVRVVLLVKVIHRILSIGQLGRSWPIMDIDFFFSIK